MVENEWDRLFADLPTDYSAAVAEPDAAILIQDDTTPETDTEDRVSAAPSIYSLTSSLRDQSFRQVHGRSLNTHSDVYSLPADEEEAHRLDKQHYMFYLLAQNDYYYGMTERIRQVLAPTSERQRRVVDLGCGPGTWTLQCATDFPHVDVLGIDLAPTCTTAPPSNCHFEIDDLNLGLEHFFGPTFDLIHARLINSGIRDYAGLVDQTSRCLRPGGMVIFVETDFRIWAEDKRILIPPNFYTPLPTKERPPLGSGSSGSVGPRGGKLPTVLTNWALPTWMATMSKCVRAKGGNIDSATLLKTWVMEHPNYMGVQALDQWSPLGPWKAATPNDWTEHPNFKIVGEMSRDSFISLMKGARPLLYEWFSDPEVSKLEGDAVRELESAANPMYGRTQVSWGYRRGVSTSGTLV
ncbi:S-adenosyl-L-methionine-dependent methyltransferase [Ceratobasidium sp. AG-I]|nr:S-adenosyl-L-methionine-dependent methyltransferase [Ceratobasidium sp. AG-I]